MIKIYSFSDDLPPEFDEWQDNITEFTSTPHAVVNWIAPNYADPHGQSEVRIIAQNYYEPQASLQWGEYIVQYVAQTTNDAMQTECAFSVSIYRKLVMKSVRDQNIVDLNNPL